MRVSDKGPIPWIVWALFSWRGKIKRAPYIVVFAILFLLLARMYQIAVIPLAAEYVFPPAGGAPVTEDHLRQLVTSPAILPFLLPLFYMYTVLDIKRLRSIEAPLALAPFFAAVSLAAPVVTPAYVEMVSLSVFAYHAILAVIPAKEDRISPYERKYRVWQALAKPEGGPIRLSGNDIRHWHIVSQGRGK